MVVYLSSLSKQIESKEDNDEDESNNECKKGRKDCTTLTVWRKSLVFSCNGFTVIDARGDLAYRVDNYIGHPPELTLMNASGKPILTMIRRRKKLRLLDDWLVYEGEVTASSSSKEAIFCVRKHISISNSNVIAQVFETQSDKKNAAYVIEGSFLHRSCQMLDKSRRVVAKIKRKEPTNCGISFGFDVFVLVVKPGFDPGFAMAMVLLLDQMFSYGLFNIRRIAD
ncbi:LURP-one-related [Dillenia turbinata]|uniref:LURP-one-related n=1 Tax=Dillenia turbinata TaxID=194707 RepID=A0AAN8VPE2_9MAGN